MGQGGLEGLEGLAGGWKPGRLSRDMCWATPREAGSWKPYLESTCA